MERHKVHAAISSTRDLLKQIAHETHRTLREIKYQDIDTTHLVNYGLLSEQLDDLAADAASLADQLRNEPLTIPQPEATKDTAA
jgi:hypothetical protein